PYVTSDHCPSLLVITDVTKKKRRAFRFMNYLTEKKNFHKLVNDKSNEPIKGYAMFVFAKRLKNMKRHLRDLNKKNGNVHEKVKMLRTELKKVQVVLDEDLNNSTLKEIEIVFNKAYREATLDEERILKQKAKVNWLKDSFLGTFEEIFPIDMAEDQFKNKVNPKSALHMTREVSKDEVKVALFDIEDDKALRPDGFTSKFFKASWSIMGDDLFAAVNEFFISGKMVRELNTTLISFVPKCICRIC
ncbi:hypothetical protein Tco_1521148, partial [Tanacetum coccineum]